MKMEQTPKSPNFFKKVGILVGFIAGILTQVFCKMSDAELQYWHARKKFIETKVLKLFNQSDIYAEEREIWRRIYQKYFSLDVNLAEVNFPDKLQEGGRIPIVALKGLTMNFVYDCMSKFFECTKYTEDLDASVTKNARTTSETYVICVRDGVEPDVEYLGKSANEADPEMKLGETVLERMLHEIYYFETTGKHLDIAGWTRCTGSRLSGGLVPLVYFRGEGVRVSWGFPGDSDPRSGLREAVSHFPK